MKLGVIVKMRGLVVLGLATSNIASLLLAQTNPTPPNSSPVEHSGRLRAPVEFMATERTTSSEPRPNSGVPVQQSDDQPSQNDLPALGKHHQAAFSMRNCFVSAKDGIVSVSAKVDVRDKRKNIIYVWALKVQETQENGVVKHHLYKDQCFNFDPALTSMSPTFRESFKLTPGQYRVRVELHQLSAGLDVASLEVDAMPPMSKLLSVSRVVSVSN